MSNIVYLNPGIDPAKDSLNFVLDLVNKSECDGVVVFYRDAEGRYSM